MTMVILDHRQEVQEGLDFILNHFYDYDLKFPRAISTAATNGMQILVHNKEEALTRFQQANYLDCRISAYPPNADENPSAIARFQGFRTATPSSLIVMVDLDRCNFTSIGSLTVALNATLRKIKEILGVNSPTVLWSGRGLHIIQPLDANGIILEYVKQFENEQQISLKFLRFAEWFLSRGKSDQAHNTTVSFRNCMLKIPGSINSKNGQVVSVFRKWNGNGHRPEINYLLRDFRRWLIDQKIRQEQERQKRKRRNNSRFVTDNRNQCDNGGIISWIERLLQTSLQDYRKLSIWRVLAPYLLNIRHLSPNEAQHIIQDWLDGCNQLRQLDFNPNHRIKSALNSSKGFLPISSDKLKVENQEFYNLLQERGVYT